ncbi:probable ATP-dependent RNA helicase DDX49 [Pollicipes pollicipes]|uniref:probable ATP-dependent RNA helicase DDX49 n=1 Tax=Pollicipes pollicipes TaxID=41117 RepID=UPI001885A08C|nr:probable ATP-dependent RNA helicase DDX49 [Pollicipes pollicipes]XP_037070607.1 probable ATP-dependent RNA helicase DDX49 [Pollicipes pollicipes]XP_037070608.1 probable ATP-dependent RNA helicase DDX49 [Pollicipes pollicipes]
MAFAELKLSDWMLDQLKVLGLRTPTDVQLRTIPKILEGFDCIACAKTGSGKTLAFALPILEELSKDPYGIFALVLTPTRELALQIADQFRILGRPIGLQDAVVIGGQDMVEQGASLQRRPHVVIATPGRLVDHLTSCDTFSLKKVKFLVLDEADRLIAGRFDDDLATIFGALPQRRQTLLFSATCNDTLRQLEGIANSECFYYENMGEVATVDQLLQEYVLCARDVKDPTLVHLVHTFLENKTGQVIVFTNKCRSSTVMSMTLNRMGVPSIALHSQIKQRERTASLAKFKSNTVRVLFTTDVGSRGLDIPLVDMIINYDLPSVPKEYIHRVGRTARAGRRGQAVSIITPSELHLMTQIEATVGSQLQQRHIDDKEIVKIVTEVQVTKRAQELKVTDSEVVERRRINKLKDLILKGLDPEAAARAMEAVSQKSAGKRKKSNANAGPSVKRRTGAEGARLSAKKKSASST